MHLLEQKPESDQPTPPESPSRARTSAAFRMVGLAVGVVIGMVVGVSLDSIPIGVALGIGIGLGVAALLDRAASRR